MLTYRLHSSAGLIALFFSFFFGCLCYACSNFLFFWVFMELGSLSLIPALFLGWGCYSQSVYGSLLLYIVISGLSSVLIVSGYMYGCLTSFLVMGLLLKFGLFPFSLWVYSVLSFCNWLTVFIFTVVLKLPVFFLSYLIGGFGLLWPAYFCVFGIALSGVLFLCFSNSWYHVWCHISISSVSTLVLIGFYSSLYGSICVFCIYSFLAALSLRYLSGLEGGIEGSLWSYIVLFLATPVSVPLYYKLVVCFQLTDCPWYLFIVWGFYAFVEQLFLFKYASGHLLPAVFVSWH